MNAIEAEICRAVEIDKQIALEKGALSEQGSVEMGLFPDLLEIVPTTLAGVVALVTYLDEVNKRTLGSSKPLIGTLATAFNRMGAQFA